MHLSFSICTSSLRDTSSVNALAALSQHSVLPSSTVNIWVKGRHVCACTVVKLHMRGSVFYAEPIFIEINALFVKTSLNYFEAISKHL